MSIIATFAYILLAAGMMAGLLLIPAALIALASRLANDAPIVQRTSSHRTK